ncbi:hypothetical protein B0H13DRAFT_1903515 [Mycena leptocephala]|nr:hypothetical protein B0H13DRAFT_1903515 [Mycena leptocephala]
MVRIVSSMETSGVYTDQQVLPADIQAGQRGTDGSKQANQIIETGKQSLTRDGARRTVPVPLVRTCCQGSVSSRAFAYIEKEKMRHLRGGKRKRGQETPHASYSSGVQCTVEEEVASVRRTPQAAGSPAGGPDKSAITNCPCAALPPHPPSEKNKDVRTPSVAQVEEDPRAILLRTLRSTTPGIEIGRTGMFEEAMPSTNETASIKRQRKVFESSRPAALPCLLSPPLAKLAEPVTTHLHRVTTSRKARRRKHGCTVWLQSGSVYLLSHLPFA